MSIALNSTRPRSIEVAGVSHGAAPIPMGARVGNIVYSSGIMGKDPVTDQLPADVKGQAKFVFQNMKALLENAGAELRDVVRVTAYIVDDSVRDALNLEWIKCFPDAHDRPARHTLLYPLTGGMLLQIEIVAVIQE